MGASLLNLGHNYLVTTQNKFETIGSITVQGSTLAVGVREWGDVKTYFNNPTTAYVGWSVPKDANLVELRFQTTADGNAHVVEVWGAAGQDSVTLIATLTLTGGTQEVDSVVFVDTIIASTQGLYAAGVVMDSAANRICRYAVNTFGYSKLLFLATTLQASTTLKIEGRGI